MSQTAPPPRPVTSLPVWRTVVAAYRSVLRDNLQYLPRAAVGPLILSLILGFIDLALSPGPGAGPEAAAGPPNMLLSVILGLLGMAPYVIFAVAWHRLILLGPQTAAPSAIPSWQRHHWVFLGYSLLVSVVFFGLVLIAGLLGGLLGGGLMGPDAGTAAEPAPGRSLMVLLLVLVLGLFALVVMMRLSFVFPAVAVEEQYGLGDAWRHTQGQGPRLLGAVILASLPFFLLLMILGGVFGGVIQSMQGPGEMGGSGSGGGLGFALLLLISVAVGYVWTAVGVSLISIAFRTCSGWIPGPGGSPRGSPSAGPPTGTPE